MRKTILFIAMSLDGYIADKNGKVDWLNGQSNVEENIDSYSEFIKDIDTVLMGWNTYHQVKIELSPNEWPYNNLHSYVITHHQEKTTSHITFTNQNPTNLLKNLKTKEGKNIWICGGANLINQLLETDSIDELYISVIPTLLGNGIKLFNTLPKEKKLSLIKTRNYNGIVELIYKLR